jgi:hypothetical protein
VTVRLILRRDDANMAANVGGAVLTSFVTIDIDHDELEAHLRSGGFGENGLSHTQLVGAEVLHPGAPDHA